MIDWKKFEDLLIDQGFSYEDLNCVPPARLFRKSVKILNDMEIKLSITSNYEEKNASFEISIDENGVVKTIYSGFNQDVFKGYFMMTTYLNKCFTEYKKI